MYAVDRVRGWRVDEWIGWIVAIAVLAAVMWRVSQSAVSLSAGEPWPLFGFVDFRDTVIVPTRDLLAGNNPYDMPAYLQRHPASQPFNLYLPQTFVYFGWMAFLPTLVQVLVIGCLTFVSAIYLLAEGCRLAGRRGYRALPWIVCLLTLRGPILMCIRQGQIALVLAAAAWLVVSHRPRGQRAMIGQSVALSLAIIKPQLGVPIVVLLMLMHRWRNLVGGAIATCLLAAAPVTVAVMAAGGLEAFVDSLITNLTASSGDDAFLAGPLDVPGNLRALGWTSTAVMVGSMLAVLVVLVAAFWLGLRRAGRDGSGDVAWNELLVWLLGFLCILVLPNLRYAAAIMFPPLMWTTIRTCLGPRRGADHVVLAGAAVLTWYAVLRSASLESAIGLPETWSRLASGWSYALAGLLAVCAVFLPGSGTSGNLEAANVHAGAAGSRTHD